MSQTAIWLRVGENANRCHAPVRHTYYFCSFGKGQFVLIGKGWIGVSENSCVCVALILANSRVTILHVDQVLDGYEMQKIQNRGI